VEEKHYIRTRAIIEILGKPKDHVEETLKNYTEKIKEDGNLMALKTDFAEAKLQKEDVWSAFAELELVFKNLPSLIGFCFDYMPSSVEIIKPEKLALTNLELADITNDLQARLHHVDMSVKELTMENNFLKKNLKISLQNTILILLKINKLTKEQISIYTGISLGEIEPFLDEMAKQEQIKKEGEIYLLK